MRKFSLSLFIFPVLFLKGQAIAETQEWLGLFNQFAVSQVRIKTDAQLRWADEFKKWRTLAFRTGIQKPINKCFSVSAGPALFLTAINGQAKFTNEYRTWEEIAWELKKMRYYFSLRFRPEQRWIQNTQNVTAYYNRFRFRTDLFLRLGIRKNPDTKNGFVLSNELFLQQDRQAGWYKEQDRVMCGFNYYPINEFGFQFQYILLPFVRKGIVYEERQVFRINIMTEF